jgi:hypothetical protein
VRGEQEARHSSGPSPRCGSASGTAHRGSRPTSEGRNKFLCAGVSPATPLICSFIDQNQQRHRFSPICRALAVHGIRIAPRTYGAQRSAAPSKTGAVAHHNHGDPGRHLRTRTEGKRSPDRCTASGGAGRASRDLQLRVGLNRGALLLTKSVRVLWVTPPLVRSLDSRSGWSRWRRRAG